MAFWAATEVDICSVGPIYMPAVRAAKLVDMLKMVASG